MGGFNILIDLIWVDMSGLFGIGFCWIVELGICFDDLLKIDFVFVSYNYYDYMDLLMLKKLWDCDKLIIIISFGNDILI